MRTHKVRTRKKKVVHHYKKEKSKPPWKKKDWTWALPPREKYKRIEKFVEEIGIEPWKHPSWYMADHEIRNMLKSAWVWKNSEKYAKEALELIHKHGLDWAVAAMYHESIGYWYPSAAKKELEWWMDAVKRGHHSGGAERTLATAYGNLSYEIWRDLRAFEEKPKELQEKLTEKVRQMLKWNRETQITAGLLGLGM